MSPRRVRMTERMFVKSLQPEALCNWIAIKRALIYAGNVDEDRRAFRFLEVGPLTDAELTLRLAKTVDHDTRNRRVATYHLEMLIAEAVVGAIRFRAENDYDVEAYAGHLGYNVAPEFRGRHLAERTCRLLMPLAIAHGFVRLWVTCAIQTTMRLAEPANAWAPS